MIHIVLYQPEIPPNTGNIIRLCANTGAKLHLIEPLGFAVDDKKLKRAGLDYHDWTSITMHSSYEAFIKTCHPHAVYACSTKGSHFYTNVSFEHPVFLLFGPETRGLPKNILDTFSAEKIIRIPMLTNNRSLNLSNAVAIIVYEAWRQFNFIGI